MRTRATLLAVALLTGGALASPALAGPKDQPAQEIPPIPFKACGSTLVIETLSTNARERVSEGETSFQAFGRGNTLLRVVDTKDPTRTAEFRVPGRAKIEGSFDPATNTATVRFDLSGINLLLPEPFSRPVEADAQEAFGLPAFAIVYERFVGVSTGPADAEGPTSAMVERAGNRVIDVCDLLTSEVATVTDRATVAGDTAISGKKKPKK